MMMTRNVWCLLAVVVQLVALLGKTAQASDSDDGATTTTKSIDILYKFDEEMIRRDYIGQKPYLLRGIGSKWPAFRWDMDYVSREFGETIVYAYRYDRTSPNLSYLAQAMLHRKKMTINTFLNKYYSGGKNNYNKENDNSDSSSSSGEDSNDENESSNWSLKECGEVFEQHPHLLEQVHFDQIYAGPLDENVPRNAYFWIGNANSSIGLHADIADFSNLFQIQGKKRWIFFAPADRDNLYMETKTTVDGGLHSPLNVFESIDLTKYPKFAFAQPYEIVMEPGDILYVPSGWWHAVHSMTPTMSINYIASHDLLLGDTYSIGSVLESLRLLLTSYLLDLYWNTTATADTTSTSSSWKLVGLVFVVVWFCKVVVSRRDSKKQGRKGTKSTGSFDSNDGCKML